jgi:23S rRNA pseudouridine1911/1915/1917 synthase
VRKTYWVCVEGHVAPDQGRWVDWLRKVPGQPRSEAVPPEHEAAREAVLQYRVLGATPFGSRLEVTLETGRMHQVRIQFASRGHPVLGDALYGAGPPPWEQADDPRERPIALHAQALAFAHPMTHEPVHVEAPPPAHWRQLLEAP